MLTGCASDPSIEADQMIAEGRVEEGLALLKHASEENPGSREHRSQYFRQRDLAAAQWLGQADSARLAGQVEPAEALYRRVLRIDPGNSRALAGVEAAQAERRHKALLAEAEKLLNVDDTSGAGAKVRM